MGLVLNITDGTDVSAATGSQITFSLDNPFAKLDSTNPVSFENLSIRFKDDPPNPDGTILTVLDTPLTSFPHGYTYVPSTWFLFQRTLGLGVQNDGTSTFIPSYAYENSLIAVTNPADNPNGSATLLITVDSTNINISVRKRFSAAIGVVSCNIAGYQISLRSYVFVEDLT